MTEIREHLLEALKQLADVGQRADALLLNAETAMAGVAQVADEQPTQLLGVLSREVWDGHRAVQRAIRATHQLEQITTDASLTTHPGRVGH